MLRHVQLFQQCRDTCSAAVVGIDAAAALGAVAHHHRTGHLHHGSDRLIVNFISYNRLICHGKLTEAYLSPPAAGFGSTRVWPKWRVQWFIAHATSHQSRTFSGWCIDSFVWRGFAGHQELGTWLRNPPPSPSPKPLGITFKRLLISKYNNNLTFDK